ncbi:MAG: acyl--CoA ligase [Nitriliruptoraceae bacterium]|nr:acyl--CoA ligase [Nitriliruptoraceae bacterium]
MPPLPPPATGSGTDPVPWASSYPPGVPAAYQLPEVTLPRLLDDALRDAPDHPALVAGDRALDHRTVHRLVGSLTASLRTLGVEVGDRVLVAVEGRLSLPLVLLAVWQAGALPVVRDPAALEDLDELVAGGLVAVFGPRRVVRDVAETVEGGERDLVRVLVEGDRWVAEPTPRRRGPRSWWRTRRAGQAEASRSEDASRSAVDPGRIIAIDTMLGSRRATSASLAVEARDPDLLALEVPGPGARPLQLSHRQLLAAAFQSRLWVPDVQAAQERVLVVEPLRDVRLLASAWLMGLLSAATVILGEDTSPPALAAQIEADEPTLLIATGRVVRRLLRDEPALRGRSLACLRVVLTVGRPLPPEVVAAGERRTRGARIRALGGPSGVVLPTLGQPVYGRVPPGATGLPLTATAVRLVDDQGVEVAVGVVGRLEVRGPQVDPGAGGARPPWRATSTLGVIDDAGVTTIVGEVDDALHRAGGLVGRAAMEVARGGHAGLEDAAVVRQGDATTGTWVAVIVRSRRGRPTDEELRAHCLDGPLADHTPGTFVAVDRLPRTAAGTIDRPALRSRVATPPSPPTGRGR